MSHMLEEVLADVAALKEAAIKKAESVLEEKYASQIKEAVEAILEQDDELEDDLSGLDAPMDMGASEESSGSLESELSDEIPLAATDGEKLCPCQDEEDEIEIDFDELTKQMSAEEEPEMTSHDELADEMDDIELGLQESENPFEEEQVGEGCDKKEKIEEAVEGFQVGDKVKSDFWSKERPKQGGMPSEYDFPKWEQWEKEAVGTIAGKMEGSEDYYEVKWDKPNPDKKTTTRVKYDSLSPYSDSETVEEEFDLSETDLEEIMEELKVDLESVPNGYQVTNQQEKEREMDIALATAADSKFQEENEQLKKDVEELQEQIKQNKDINQKILKENKTFKSLIAKMCEKLKAVNLNNTKLAYKNTVLSSGLLNTKQKNKIVEAISKTATVEEVKALYEALQGGMGTLGTSKQRPESLSEAISRNLGSSMVVKSQKDQPQKHDPALSRMRKLAGIGE